MVKDIETKDSTTQFLNDINIQKSMLMERHKASINLNDYLTEEGTIDEKKIESDYEKELEMNLLSEDKSVRDKAINNIFIMNARLIMFFSKGYFGKGYSSDDIVANGSIGLLEGIKRFDPTQEFKLSTYVSWYIRKYILKYMEENDLIRIPSYLNNDYLKYSKTKEELSIKFGRIPEDVEVAAALDIDLDKLEKIKSCKYNITSLDMKLSDEEDSDTLSEIIPDENNVDIFREMNNQELKKALSLVLEDLLPNERQVIEYRFGLNDQPTYTLNLIGEKMNLSSERIRQIENSALRKLRNKARKKILQPYLED